MLPCLNSEKAVKKLLSLSKSTMVLIKPGTIQLALDSFNSFHEILRFAVDRFENEMLDFLNIKMSSQCLTVYRKTTQTGQYVHYDSFVP